MSSPIIDTPAIKFAFIGWARSPTTVGKQFPQEVDEVPNKFYFEMWELPLHQEQEIAPDNQLYLYMSISEQPAKLTCAACSAIDLNIQNHPKIPKVPLR